MQWLPASVTLPQPALDQLGSALAMALSADERWLVISNENGQTVILNLANSQARVILNDAGVYQVAFSRDGQYLFTNTWDQPIRQWAVSTGELVRWFENTNSTNFAVSPDGRTLATSDQNGALRFWEVETGAPISAVAAHSNAAWKLAFSADGRQLFTQGDGFIKFWVAP
ncbi:MAG: PD40 domain-containing protein [Anaerolineales bacterium]|nr:PD40 domain-containing protein [Anaerolineales bacterium]